MKIGGRWIPVTHCASCGLRMLDHGSRFDTCLSCLVPRHEGERSRAYRKRVNQALGINLGPKGEAY